MNIIKYKSSIVLFIFLCLTSCSSSRKNQTLLNEIEYKAVIGYLKQFDKNIKIIDVLKGNFNGIKNNSYLIFVDEKNNRYSKNINYLFVASFSMDSDCFNMYQLNFSLV